MGNIDPRMRSLTSEQLSAQSHSPTLSKEPSATEQVSLKALKEQTLEPQKLDLKATIAVPQKSIQTEWHSLRLTEAQLDEFQAIIKDVIGPIINEDKVSPENQLCSAENLQPIVLDNGNTLHAIEASALKFYTLDGFRLLNGSFDHDESIKKFMENREITLDKFEQVKHAGKMLSLIATSALNKMPSSADSEVYRGDAISEDKLKQLEPGAKLHINRFSSTTKYEGVAEQFAMTNAMDRNLLNVTYVILNPTRARDVELLSKVMSGNESERIYAPKQTFEVVKVTIEEEPDLTDITDFDDLINKARDEGKLVEKTNAKGKIKYYEQTGTTTSRKIYLKEG